MRSAMVQKRACDACHKRKIQCDSTNTEAPCNWCDHHGLACTFNRVRGRKKNPRAKRKLSVEQSLSSRLERIEDALAKTLAQHDNATTSSNTSTPSTSTPITSTPTIRTCECAHDTTESPSEQPGRPPEQRQNPVSLGEQFAAYDLTQSPFISTPSSNFTTSASFGHIHYGGCHLGQIRSHNGMPILSEEGCKWVQQKTGEDVSFSKFHVRFQKQALPPTLSPWHFFRSENELHELPDKRIVEQVLDVFINSAFRLVFPVIDRVLFEETVILAYEECGGPLSLERISAKGCVLAFVSIMCLFQGQDANIPAVDSDTCAVKAHYLLSDVFEDSSIVSLQTVFMLHMHQTFSGRLQSAAMLHAIACRIVFMLGGHTYKPTKSFGAEATHKEREERQLRMLFWLCYIFDKDVALRTGQPPLMSDDYCDLTLPEDYLDCYKYLPELEESLFISSGSGEDLTPHLPGDPRLSHLKDKTCRLLYSAQALSKSDAELLRDIRELDDELEYWRLSIPPAFRPTLSISENMQVLLPKMKLPRSMRHISLHVEYHHLMTMIHKASGRCFPLQTDSDGREEWSGGVRSSVALSLEASRSTLIYLKAAVNGLAGEAFWFVVFYPTSAIMTLFLNILMYPLDPQAQLDIELLAGAADIVRSMPVRRMTAHKISHIKIVNEFILETIKLANCAISKAMRDQEQGGS
ncbi:fungal-specific transcription factor domain-containing protein [Diaporthe sp. PMI_573]|nr:fungal-specific transcription factor domain-containing protein [Diaporthaceae sp. PMI_573]